MCAIFGIVNLNSKLVSLEIVKEMGKTIAYRGPDNTGYFFNNNICIGNNRLSIIDLENGNQPIFNEDKSVCIVLNGEIYNYQELMLDLKNKGHVFLTKSDTEVLVHLYEEYKYGMLDLMSGMFAFCLIDLKNKIVFCARDRFGEKPFYYTLTDNQFLFASEIKALMKNIDLSLTISDKNIIKYFYYGYTPLDKTFFNEIKKLKAGHYIVLNYENGSSFIKEYWNIFDNKIIFSEYENPNEAFDQLFLNSIKERMISDVPLGVLLSGGIDSSLVVSYMSKICKNIKTFNVSFLEQQIDESIYAKKVSDLFKTEHYTAVITDKDIYGNARDILCGMDDPIADPSIIPTYTISKFARQYVKVVLSGDGGDEIFGGYPKYYIHRYTEMYEQLPDYIKRKTNVFLCNLFKINKSYYKNPRIKRYFAGLQYPPEIRNQLWISPFLPDELEDIFVTDYYCGNGLFDESSEIAEDIDIELDAVNRAMYMDIKLTLNDLFLAKVDRASMLNSLEVRTPFLDHEFAEYFFNMPSADKVRGLTTKYFLRKVLSKHLPKDIAYRKKQGFGIPLAEWLRGGLRIYVSEMLEKCEGFRFFNHESIRKIVDEHMSLKSDNSYKIWALIVFANVWEKYYE